MAYNPNEARDERGRWTGAAGVAGAVGKHVISTTLAGAKLGAAVTGGAAAIGAVVSHRSTYRAIREVAPHLSKGAAGVATAAGLGMQIGKNAIAGAKAGAAIGVAVGAIQVVGVAGIIGGIAAKNALAKHFNDKKKAAEGAPHHTKSKREKV